MSERQRRAKEVQQSILTVLAKTWDPLQVGEQLGRSEYHSWVGPIYHLLSDGASDESLKAFLQAEAAGLSSRVTDESLNRTVDHLQEINVRLNTR